MDVGVVIYTYKIFITPTTGIQLQRTLVNREQVEATYQLDKASRLTPIKYWMGLHDS